MDRTRKTDQENGILYYVRMCGSRDAQSAVFMIFKTKYLENHASNHSKVYHFLDQFYEFCPLVPFIFVSWAPLKKSF